MTIKSAIRMCSQEIKLVLGKMPVDASLQEKERKTVLDRVGFALEVLAEGMDTEHETMSAPKVVSDDDVLPDEPEDQAVADRRAGRRIRSFWG